MEHTIIEASVEVEPSVMAGLLAEAYRNTPQAMAALQKRYESEHARQERETSAAHARVLENQASDHKSQIRKQRRGMRRNMTICLVGGAALGWYFTDTAKTQQVVAAGPAAVEAARPQIIRLAQQAARAQDAPANQAAQTAAYNRGVTDGANRKAQDLMPQISALTRQRDNEHALVLRTRAEAKTKLEYWKRRDQLWQQALNSVKNQACQRNFSLRVGPSWASLVDIGNRSRLPCSPR